MRERALGPIEAYLEKEKEKRLEIKQVRECFHICRNMSHTTARTGVLWSRYGVMCPSELLCTPSGAVGELCYVVGNLALLHMHPSGAVELRSPGITAFSVGTFF